MFKAIPTNTADLARTAKAMQKHHGGTGRLHGGSQRPVASAVSSKPMGFELGAPGLTSSSKKLLGAKGIATRSKDATKCLFHW